MKLVTFQSIGALKYLVNNGYLICDESYINKIKAEPIYNWVTEKMNQKIKNDTKAKYPIWAWVKCYNSICPPKRIGEPVDGFDVKITFHKNKKDIFITDFRRYSFLLNNTYIPDDLDDKAKFDKILKKYNITEEELKAFVRKDKYDFHRTDEKFLEVCELIKKSYDKCITIDSEILQGCVWKIRLSEVESIVFLNDKNYRFGSLNYLRKKGKRMNWQKAFYKRLK